MVKMIVPRTQTRILARVIASANAVSKRPCLRPIWDAAIGTMTVHDINIIDGRTVFRLYHFKSKNTGTSTTI